MNLPNFFFKFNKISKILGASLCNRGADYWVLVSSYFTFFNKAKSRHIDICWQRNFWIQDTLKRLILAKLDFNNFYTKNIFSTIHTQKKVKKISIHNIILKSSLLEINILRKMFCAIKYKLTSLDIFHIFEIYIKIYLRRISVWQA